MSKVKCRERAPPLLPVLPQIVVMHVRHSWEVLYWWRQLQLALPGDTPPGLPSPQGGGL
jgi:hypothetical protein